MQDDKGGTMEDFSLGLEKKETDDTDEISMQVSPICHKDGEKKAFVTFSDSTRYAEGEIPKCVILSNDGFSKEEIMQLEDYMEKNLEMLKSMAASVNPIKALMK